MSQSQFKKLFEPTQIGQMQLRNRIVMPPMGTCYASDKGYVSQRLIDYYEARAKGGGGLIIVEITAPYFPGRQFAHELAISDDSFIPGFRELAEAIHKHGARVAIQLHHAGREIRPNETGYPRVSPSPIPTFTGEIPQELTTDEIAEIVRHFSVGAKRAKEAGIDGVEIHGAHQYLICSFLSAATNIRKDRYGGTLENRARFLIEIIQAIREAVGPDYPVWVRLSAQEYGMENGITIEETKEVVKMAIAAGVQAIHVSAYGISSYILKAPSPDTPGFLVPLAGEVKKVATVPVIAVGRMDAELAEQVLREGKADLVSLGRRLMADPELPGKAAEGKLDDINPCIGCMDCMDSLMYTGPDTACTVNPAMGREREYQIQPAAKVKRVVVAGGGPGGMEAARVAALRGHQVVLLEKAPKLGGQLNAAALPPNKQDLLPLIGYMTRQVEKAGVDTRLETEATAAGIMENKPDVVVVAVGGIPIIPDIPGVDRPNVVTAHDALSEKAEVGESVVIIGGGRVGCEAGDYLAEKGKKVVIIEALKRVAGDMMPMVRRRLMDGLRARKVAIFTSATCEEIAEGSVTLTTGEGQKQTIPADTVILAVGYEKNDGLYKALEGRVSEVYCIGDSSQPRRIMEATNEGYRVGLSL